MRGSGWRWNVALPMHPEVALLTELMHQEFSLLYFKEFNVEL